MKIALVHDYLVQHGGAERVLEHFCALFPDAPIFTLIYDKQAMRGRFADRTIITSRLQHIPLARKQHRFFPQFMPSAIEEFDLSLYDIVLSDSSSFAKGVITRPGTVHISYMHTPMRYAWDDCQKYTNDFGLPRIVRGLVPFAMNPLRIWDRVSSTRPDYLLANSQFVARRIAKYYNREATVVHPPVDIEHFYVADTHEDYFLMVGRLIAYKRHDIAIEAFNALGLPLKIIGRGPERARLEKMAGPTIEFLDRVEDDALTEYYARCRAFVFPQEEDFGIVAIEALASGRPLIAFHGGDIVEHAREGQEAVFFDEQTPEALRGAVERFIEQESRFVPQEIRKRAEPFAPERFRGEIMAYLERMV